MNRILFLPSARQGRGTGHLSRCAEWAKSFDHAALYFPTGVDDTFDRAVVQEYFGMGERGGQRGGQRGGPHSNGSDRIDKLLVDTINHDDWDAVVIDNFRTSRREIVELSGNLPSVAIDEGGTARSIATYLIDSLPLLSPHAPNVANVGFLDLPPRKRDFDRIWNKVLVSFGGEDPAGLSTIAVSRLVKAGFPADRIALVIGPLAQLKTIPDGVNVIPTAPGLADRLWEYDLLITSFGLTAFEAIAAGIDVVLINPTRYHHELARVAGFLSAGWGKRSARRLQLLMSSPESVSNACASINIGTRTPFAEFFRSLDFSSDLGCPACKSRNRRAECRHEDRTFFRCEECGISYQVRFRPDDTTYSKGYFFEDYSRQYGKTYIEDFDHIRDLGRQRMRLIGQLARKRTNRTILDIGCAYGPFLAAAGEAAWKPFGIDISDDAVRYVRETLAIPSHAGDFLSTNIGECFSIPSFGVVTMWYVIEHFPDVASALSEVSELLETGGLFCFATPNLHGISGRRNRKLFLSNGPPDHYTIWTPRSARSVLSRYGFTVVVVRNTGHHPERFPRLLRLLGPLVRVLSEVFRLGDTFEIYAVKTGSVHG